METDSIDPHAMYYGSNVQLIALSSTRFPIAEVQHISISPTWSTIIYKSTNVFHIQLY
jgi:hypothetical protein